MLQSFNAPFFGILIIVASFESSGVLLSSKTFIMRGRRISAAIAGSVLIKLWFEVVRCRGCIVFKGLDGVDYFFLGGG